MIVLKIVPLWFAHFIKVFKLLGCDSVDLIILILYFWIVRH